MNTKTILSLLLLLTISLACGLTAPKPAPVSTFPSAPEQTPTTPAQEDSSSSNSKSDFTNETSRIERDITYCTMNGVPLHVDVYFPKNETGILLIYIHGGAWRSGNKNGGAGFVDFPALLNAGFTIASIDYRLAPEYKMPAMIEDVKCAVRYFRAHAAKYDIAPDHIGVWGTSAGGHLASMLGTADESAGFEAGEYLEYSSRVQAVVDMFGPANMQSYPVNERTNATARNIFGAEDLSDPMLAATSPVTYVTPNDPPFLILQGDQDKVVPLSQSQEFHDRLIASGVDSQLVIVNGGSHGLNGTDQSPTRAELTEMIVEFFESKLK